MSLPDFADPDLFPTFAALPSVPQSSPADSTADDATPAGAGVPWLLAQVRDDMTVVKPTLVLADRAGSPFALVFEGLARDGLDLKAAGLRKGATAAVPAARRTEPEQAGKRAFVRVPPGRAAEVRALPGPLDRVLALAARFGPDGPERRGEGACAACGKEEGVAKCVGCGAVRYCGKVSSLFLTC